VNVKIASLQTTLKTVFCGTRTDMFGDRESQMEGQATENALSMNLVLAFRTV